MRESPENGRLDAQWRNGPIAERGGGSGENPDGDNLRGFSAGQLDDGVVTRGREYSARARW